MINRQKKQIAALSSAAQGEREFQASVIQAASWMGWQVYHTHDSRRSQPGFPDLVLAKIGAPVIFAELKRVKGKLTPAQLGWICTVNEATGVQGHIWRPDQWDTILSILGGKA